MTSVSVIIPYYKKINYIKKTLQSVLDQTFKDFEIILIYDDTNLDDLTIIKKEFEDNPKIKIFNNSENLGAGASRNIGISKSSGNIIAFLDSDDFWFPEKLEKQVNFMIKNKYKFIFSDYEKKI